LEVAATPGTCAAADGWNDSGEMKRDALVRVASPPVDGRSDRQVGVGDPTSDLALAIQAHIASARVVAQQYPNDIAISGLVSQAENLLTLLDNAQAQLNTVTATATLAPTTPAAPTPTRISAPAAGFLAVGAAFVGGVAGWAGRGILEKKR
jgi:hypothetical protein